MEGGERRVKLYCPSLPKAIEIAAVDDQKLDLGSIARAFGLDPNTLKLNGYFIATTPDHIASSLTWNSLIRFFTARGLPSGAAPLLVHGKICSKSLSQTTSFRGLLISCHIDLCEFSFFLLIRIPPS